MTGEQYSDLIAERFAPPSLLVNYQENVVYTTGNLDKFVKFPNRRSDLNVYSMLKGNLLLVFRSGIRQIQDGKSKIIFSDNVIEAEEEKCIVDVVFTRIDNERRDRNSLLLLIEFHEKGISKAGDEQGEIITREKYSQSEIENLEMELKLARRELHFTADELETINEELQSSNEEMQSANEELQSTNEELQSSNEELQTVNSELKSKIDALTILHDDMLNLFNSTQIATIFLDSGLNIRKFTPPAKKYFNIRESDVGRPINHYSYNFQYSELEHSIQEVLENLQPLEFEVALKEDRFSIMRILPYKTENRQIKGVVITFTDITELKQKNNKLKKLSAELISSRQHLKSLLDNTPDLIARFNADLEYTFVNKAFLKASELNEEEIIGKHATTLEILEGSDKMKPSLMQEVLLQGIEKAFYFACHLSTGERYFYARIIPEFGKHKGVKTLLLICTDVTQLKEAEREILQSNNQLSEMYERMDNFVHAIAHDLRAPIVNLKMLTNLLLSEKAEREQKLFISEIGSVVGKLDNTLNGLIQIIEMDNEHEISVTNIDFEDELNLITSDLKAKIDQEEAVIEFDFSEVPVISYIQAYLESIIKNLISNALKYRAVDRNPSIKAKTWLKDEFVVLSISDNGMGIDLKRFGHNLFKPFKRFHTNIDGMGVGLYVINFMVGKNGGRIEVESEINKGTTFHIFLKPYAPSSVS